MNTETARPLRFLMKEDNTTYEVVLGKKKNRKKRKKETKPESDQVSRSECLYGHHSPHVVNGHLRCGLRGAISVTQIQDFKDSMREKGKINNNNFLY